MRRVAMLLGMAGVIALGLAAAPVPAQARDGWSGNPAWHGDARQAHQWREHQWREQTWRRHEWRQHHYGHPYQYGYYAPSAYSAPGVTLGFDFR